jgi:hypothetical protein
MKISESLSSLDELRKVSAEKILETSNRILDDFYRRLNILGKQPAEISAKQEDPKRG